MTIQEIEPIPRPPHSDISIAYQLDVPTDPSERLAFLDILYPVIELENGPHEEQETAWFIGQRGDSDGGDPECDRKLQERFGEDLIIANGIRGELLPDGSMQFTGHPNCVAYAVRRPVISTL